METIELLVGKKVKELRLSLGLSQAELAKNAKTSLTTINRLEKGKQFPHSSTLSDISKALGVEVKDLYSSEQKVTRNGQDRASRILELQSVLLGLSDSDFDAAEAMIKNISEISRSNSLKKTLAE